MNNGTAIKLTTARYFTPNGRSIQAKGIVPDIVVEDATESGFNLREADLTHHLSNPKDGEPAEPAKTTAPQKDKENGDKDKAERPVPYEPASKNDVQFVQAMNLLKGLQVLQKK